MTTAHLGQVAALLVTGLFAVTFAYQAAQFRRSRDWVGPACCSAVCLVLFAAFAVEFHLT